MFKYLQFRHALAFTAAMLTHACTSNNSLNELLTKADNKYTCIKQSSLPLTVKTNATCDYYWCVASAKLYHLHLEKTLDTYLSPNYVSVSFNESYWQGRFLVPNNKQNELELLSVMSNACYSSCLRFLQTTYK